MKNLLNRLISLLLAGVLLISTSGFMVYIHHCHHQQETFASVFFNFNHNEHYSCSTVPMSCCEHSDVKIISHCNSDCCEDYALLIKISPDIEPVQKSLAKLQPIVLNLPHSLSIDLLINEDDITTEQLFNPPEKTPLSGKLMVISFHQLKTGHYC